MFHWICQHPLKRNREGRRIPRQARLDKPGTLHHAIIRGIEKGAIVTDDVDRKDFVNRPGGDCRRYRHEDMTGLDRYPWCGHGVLMGRVKQAWQDRGYVLKLFGNKAREAGKAYRQFVRNVPSAFPETTGNILSIQCEK
jgi:hypothetical protein